MDTKYNTSPSIYVPTSDEVRQMLLEAHPHRILSVSIDCAKNVHQYLAVTGKERTVQRATPVETTKAGYKKFSEWLKEQVESKKYDLILLTNEPTGVYHEGWMYQLIRDFEQNLREGAQPQMIYRWQNPTAVKLERRQKYHRTRKSDVIDLWCMNALNLRGEGQAPIIQVAEMFQMQQAVSQWQQLRREQQQHQMQLLTQLDRVWPGALGDLKAFRKAWPKMEAPQLLVQTRGLTRDRVRILIEHVPNPHDIQKMSPEQIRRLFKQNGGRCGEKTAQLIWEVFNNMVLPPAELATLLAERVQAEYAMFKQRERQIATLLDEKIANLVSGTDAAVLLSLPGMSEGFVARYIAGLRDYRRFPSAGHIWSYVGFDPLMSQSGNHKRTYQISKHGDPFLRDTLFRIGFSLAQHCPPVQATFVKALERGMSVRAATIHAARKANRILFALLHSQKPFVNPLSAEKSAYWRAQYQQHMGKKRKFTLTKS